MHNRTTFTQHSNADPEEVRRDLQFMVDDLWARQDDTEDFKKMRLLIGHKPSIVEFLAYIAAQVERERAEAPWWKKILRPFI